MQRIRQLQVRWSHQKTCIVWKGAEGQEKVNLAHENEQCQHQLYRRYEDSIPKWFSDPCDQQQCPPSSRKHTERGQEPGELPEWNEDFRRESKVNKNARLRNQVKNRENKAGEDSTAKDQEHQSSTGAAEHEPNHAELTIEIRIEEFE